MLLLGWCVVVIVVVVVVVVVALLYSLETSDLSKVKEEPDHCVQTMCYVIFYGINTEPRYTTPPF